MKKKRKFWLVWLIYVTVLAILIAVLWMKVWKIMEIYEAAQPKYAVDTLMEQLAENRFAGEIVVSENKFESSEVYAQAFSDSVKDRQLTYRAESSGSRIVYGIYADDVKVATAVMEEYNQQPLMTILTVSDWKVARVEAVTAEGQCSVHLEIPEDYYAVVNGILLSGEEQVGEPVPMEGMEYVSEYVEIPYYVTYEVKGLLKEPKVELWDAQGNPVEPQEMPTDEGGWTMCASVTYGEQEMPQELKTYVTQAALDYSNFFSGDLAGSSKSTACLQKYFPKDSYYIELAERYRRGDMWMYSSHDTPTFDNLEVTEYIPYSENCFSCRVVFDKSIHLRKTGATRVEHNDQTYFYVKPGDNWVIADIKSNE